MVRGLLASCLATLFTWFLLPLCSLVTVSFTPCLQGRYLLFASISFAFPSRERRHRNRTANDVSAKTSRRHKQGFDLQAKVGGGKGWWVDGKLEASEGGEAASILETCAPGALNWALPISSHFSTSFPAPRDEP